MSFAAEMKDFVSAWTSVSEIGNNKKRLDLQREEIENLKAYRDATLALDREQLELSKKNSDRNYALASKRNADAASAAEAKKMNAVFEGLSGLEESNFDWDQEGAAEAIPTEEPAFRRGGLVARAADGGLIEEDPDLPFVDPQNPYVDPEMNRKAREAQAIPVDAPAAPQEQPALDPMGNATGMAAEPEVDPAAAETVSNDAATAIADAAPALVEDTKKKPAAIGPDAETEAMDIVNNKGGLSMDEYKELIATIDPNDSIPAYLKSATVLATTHRYFMENGQPEKAQRVAKGILILNKQMTQTLGALAQNAMEEGNIPEAAQLVSDAANQFPTGHQFKVTPGEDGSMTYTVMKNGKEAGSGALTTEQLWELTGKVKDGSLFIEEMGRIAGAKSKKIGPEQALELTANAYATAMQAKEALDLAIEDGADEEELNALREKANSTGATYKKYLSNSLKMGLKRTDIIAVGEQALEMAIPAEPAPEEPGWFDKATGFIADSFTTSEAPEAAAPAATSQGNLAAPPPEVLAVARAAIERGAPPDAVAKRLAENGYSIEGL